MADTKDDDPLTLDELTELLANVEGISPEELERGAAELEIAPPWDADIEQEDDAD